MNHWKITQHSLGPLQLLMDQSEIEAILFSLFDSLEFIPEPWYGYDGGSCVRYCLGKFGVIFLVWYDHKNKSICISADKSLALTAEVTLEAAPWLPIFTTRASTLIGELNRQAEYYFDDADWSNISEYTFPQLGISLWRENCFHPTGTGGEIVQADEYDHLYFDFVRVYDPIYSDSMGLTNLYSVRQMATGEPTPDVAPLTGSIGPLQLGMTQEQAHKAIRQTFAPAQASSVCRGRVLETTYLVPGGSIRAWYLEGRAIAFSISQPLFDQAFPDATRRFQFPLLSNPDCSKLQDLCSRSLCVQNGNRSYFPDLSICLEFAGERIAAVGLIDPRWERLLYLVG